jgi:hypothetical protein
MHLVLVGLPQGVGGLACYFILFYFTSFHNMHQVLIGLPQGVDVKLGTTET